jgi:hypothetical protein
MLIAHPRTRDDENETIPEIRGMVKDLSWNLECSLTPLRDPVEDIHESKCYPKTDKRRNEEGFSCIECFMPVWEITIEIPDRDRNSEDWSDEGMRRWGRDPEVPRPEIPDDRGDEEWENDTDSISERGGGDCLEWEEVDDPHSNRDPTDEDTEGIHAGSEDHWLLRLESIGIDDGCYGIRGIMESVDKLECAYEEETETERDIDNIHKLVW